MPQGVIDDESGIITVHHERLSCLSLPIQACKICFPTSKPGPQGTTTGWRTAPLVIQTLTGCCNHATHVPWPHITYTRHREGGRTSGVVDRAALDQMTCRVGCWSAVVPRTRSTSHRSGSKAQPLHVITGTLIAGAFFQGGNNRLIAYAVSLV
jgi:hypothetical protein